MHTAAGPTRAAAYAALALLRPSRPSSVLRLRCIWVRVKVKGQGQPSNSRLAAPSAVLCSVMEYSFFKKRALCHCFPYLSYMMSAGAAAVCVMIRAFEAPRFRISVSSFTASKSRGSLSALRRGSGEHLGEGVWLG